MNILSFKTLESWAELRSQWNRLLARSEADTVFLTWEWMQAWWLAYGNGRQLYVLAGYDGGELVGIAPLCITAMNSGARYRRLHFIGDGSNDSDYLSFIVAAGREREFVDSLVEYLSSDAHLWDVADLEGPLEGARVTTALIAAARDKGWEISQEPIPCATLLLPGCWNEYLETLKPRFRTKVRSALAFLENQMKSAPQGCVNQEQLAPWLNAMFDLHTRRWRIRGQSGVFQNQAKRVFYQEISRSALEDGRLALYRLDWGERVLALQYGFVYGNRFYLLQEGYDPEFESIRPGLTLRAWMMRHWIERGLREYDFLAGQSSYKLDWGGRPKTSLRIRIGVRARAKLLHFLLPQTLSSAKRTVRGLVPERLLAARKALLERQKLSLAEAVTAPPRGRGKLQALAALYSLPPLGSLGRLLTDNYHAVGGQSGVSLVRRQKPVCQILQFHRVNDGADPFMPAVAVSAFRQQMEYLAKHFRVVSLDDVVSGAAFDGASRFCVAITLDDGYRDNFLYAFPILKQLGLPATIFLATGYVDTGRMPWYDQVCLAFKLTTVDSISFAHLAGPRGPIDQRSSRLALLEQTLYWLRGMKEQERGDALRTIFQVLRTQDDLNLPNIMLSWNEIRQMQAHRITFGGHTIWHPALAKLPRTRLEEEILGCKRMIETRLQEPVRHFAYPFGKNTDIGNNAKAIVCDSGFQSAVTTVWGFNDNEQDRFELRRCTPWESELASFALKLDWNRFFVSADASKSSFDPDPSFNSNADVVLES